MTRVGSYISPVDPAGKAAALQRNLNNGWGIQPGVSSIEEGFVLKTEDDDAPDLYIPPLPGPPARTDPGAGNWVALYAALGIVACSAALVGLVVAHG